MKRTLVAFVLGLAVVAFAAPAGAQKRGKGAAAAASSYQKVKNYDFSGDTIDGELVRPDGEMLNTRGELKHTSLIRVRTEFIKEIIKSAEDL